MSNAEAQRNFQIAVSYISDIFSILSIIGAILTIVTFLIFKNIRTYAIKLVMYVCLSLIFAHFFFLVSYWAAETGFCIPAAVLTHYFFLANFFWTTCVALNFYLMIVRRNREVEEFEKWYHVVCWFGSAIIVSSVGLADHYGKIPNAVYGDLAICYMTDRLSILFSFFLPGLICISSNVVFFFFVAREIHITLKEAPQAQMDEKAERRKEFRVYVSIVISVGLFWIFGFLSVLFTDVLVLSQLFSLLFNISTPIQGILIFAIYCLNFKVLARWAALIGGCIPYFKRWERLGSTQSTGSN